MTFNTHQQSGVVASSGYKLQPTMASLFISLSSGKTTRQDLLNSLASDIMAAAAASLNHKCIANKLRILIFDRHLRSLLQKASARKRKDENATKKITNPDYSKMAHRKCYATSPKTILFVGWSLHAIFKQCHANPLHCNAQIRPPVQLTEQVTCFC